MNHFEQARILETFRVIVDTREHSTPKASERFGAFGAPYERATLSYGDYCGNITLPSGRFLHSLSGRISAPCVIERKMSLDELAMCFTRERVRFQREFERAARKKAKVFLLVENASWEAIINHRYRSRLHPDAFRASLEAWAIRYNMTPVFCRTGTAGILIRDFLYRDIKERVENGEYG